jgi:hypothetical protein
MAIYENKTINSKYIKGYHNNVYRMGKILLGSDSKKINLWQVKFNVKGQSIKQI